MIKISLCFNDDKQTIETHKITNVSSKSPEPMSVPGALPARQRAGDAPGVCMVPMKCQMNEINGVMK
jgi:hypothetical protein